LSHFWRASHANANLAIFPDPNAKATRLATPTMSAKRPKLSNAGIAAIAIVAFVVSLANSFYWQFLNVSLPHDKEKLFLENQKLKQENQELRETSDATSKLLFESQQWEKETVSLLHDKEKLFFKNQQLKQENQNLREMNDATSKLLIESQQREKENQQQRKKGDETMLVRKDWRKNLLVFKAIPVNPSICPGIIERIGQGDGSKVICNVAGLVAKNGKCVVHSYGANVQIQFDTELKNLTNCEFHSFDINPKLLESTGPRLQQAGVIFHLWGIGDHEFTIQENGVDVPIKTFQTIMKELGNTQLDILKMDVEGAEYESLMLPAESPGCQELPATVQQILVELHVWQESSADHLK
jgi:FkbM family methyltransferase